MSELKRSERNSIIEDYRNGVLNPNYEVIQTKTKGRYTVRKRKIPLTNEQLRDAPKATSFGSGIPSGATGYEDKTQEESMSKVNGPKRSKKENALFDLQNQLNAQMLYRLNELTNKVIKLKTWKKKMKKDLYEDEDEGEQLRCPTPIGGEQLDSSKGAGIPSGACPTSIGSEDEPSMVQPSMEDNSRAYLSQIPSEYGNEQLCCSTPIGGEQYEEQYEVPPQVYYGNRGGIDYSRFGF